MKILSFFVFLSFFVGAVAVNGQTSSKSYDNINAEGLKKMMSSNDVVVLDVRTSGEYAQGKISNASNYNVFDPKFASNVAILDKSKKYVVYCKTGRRSLRAASIMAKQGFTVSNLTGGYMGWKRAGN